MWKSASLQTDTRAGELTTERTENTEEKMPEIALHQLTERINLGP